MIIVQVNIKKTDKEKYLNNQNTEKNDEKKVLIIKNDKNNEYSEAIEVIDEKKNQILKHSTSYHTDNHVTLIYYYLIQSLHCLLLIDEVFKALIDHCF